MFKRVLAQLLNIEIMSGVVTWLVVASSSVYLIYTTGEQELIGVLAAAALYIVFIVAWLVAVRDEAFRHDRIVRTSLIVLQYGCILGVFFLVPFTFSAILLVLWSAQLPYLVSMRKALLFSPLYLSPLWLIYTYYWQQDYVLLSTVLYWTFNMFALVTVNAMLRESRAREAANELNRELMATQALLSEASKQAERVRIARNIHDLLGHHLTAMTINLQVASRITEGDARQKVEQCHSLAKLLLSDVREAVSEIRERSNLQLEAALHALVDSVPQLKVHMDYDDDLQISDVNVAETIIRCVQESMTNSLKHSNASEFLIALSQRESKVNLTMQDNGSLKNPIQPGNGLTGIRERVNALGGEVRFQSTREGFLTSIQLPEMA